MFVLRVPEWKGLLGHVHVNSVHGVRGDAALLAGNHEDAVRAACRERVRRVAADGARKLVLFGAGHGANCGHVIVTPVTAMARFGGATAGTAAVVVTVLIVTAVVAIGAVAAVAATAANVITVVPIGVAAAVATGAVTSLGTPCCPAYRL